MKWRIYYRDGKTFDDTQGSCFEAPGDGLICIVQAHPKCGRTVMQKWDWYYWHNGEREWWGSEIHGLLYQLTHDPLGYIQAVKQGAMVSNEDFRDITKRAVNDPDFPVKSYPLPNEAPTVHR